MNDILLSILLGIIQGLTEFLPISSSAHLLFPSLLFGAQDLGLSFDIAVHGGTLLAVLMYFKSDLSLMLQALNPFAKSYNENSRQLALYLLIATFPIIVFGFIGSNFIENRNFGVVSIAYANLFFAGFLLLAFKFGSASKTIYEVSVLTVLLIGIFQVFALMPGASRSGVVITAALIAGLNLKESSKFAFLLSIPTILGALVFLLIDSANSIEAVNYLILLIGFCVSAIFAFYTIKIFLTFVEKIGMYPFVVYRLILGIILLSIV